MTFYKTATPHPSPTHERLSREHSQLPHSGCAWLFASSGSRTTTIILVYASGNLTPNELLHVHRVGEGERVVRKCFSSYMGKGEGIVIKLLLVVRVDATHQSSTLDFLKMLCLPMHKLQCMHAASFLLILSCVDLMHLEV